MHELFYQFCQLAYNVTRSDILQTSLLGAPVTIITFAKVYKVIFIQVAKIHNSLCFRPLEREYHTSDTIFCENYDLDLVNIGESLNTYRIKRQLAMH